MSRKLLFVDDEQNILDGLSRLLGRRFEVHTALGGEAGLRTLNQHGPFAVVLADMRMPIMDGIEFLKRVRQADPKVVLMMLTGNADRETAIDALERGKVFQFLTKPCSEDVLVQALEAGLELYSLQHQISDIKSFTHRKAA